VSRLVVFDLDDTLYLVRDFVRSGFRAVADHVRRTLRVRGCSRWRGAFRGGERGTVFDHALAERGIAPSKRLVQEMVRVYRTHDPRVRLCPDARRFLRRPPAATTLAIISDGPLAAQRAKVRALGLGPLVSAIVLTGRWGPRFAKPHPRAFEMLERRFRIPGALCSYVGDNPAKDFDTPLALGWTVVRLRRPEGLHARLPGPAIPEVRSCEELERCLPSPRSRA
jgi:putative hydrolase of the HAD superfamily